MPLAHVEDHGHEPFGTGLEALDRVLGRGLVPGSALLMGGEPGIGKSTLLLQMAGAVAASGKLVLYASGEESLQQIKDRDNRLGMLHDNLLALSTSRVEDLLPLLEGDGAPDLLIVDSVQTFTSESAEGLPGNVSQVRAVATEIVDACKRGTTTVVLVGPWWAMSRRTARSPGRGCLSTWSIRSFRWKAIGARCSGSCAC